MKIKFVELQSFRKLKSVRIDFDDESTILVGANNSGKTSAMVALGHFLVDRSSFNVNDFTLSNWKKINEIGNVLESLSADPSASPPGLEAWIPMLPTLDLWFEANVSELHRLTEILPTMSWNGGLIGVRIRFQPAEVEALNKEYIALSATARETVEEANKKSKKGEIDLKLWPESMHDFLSRRLNSHFGLKYFTLDPSKIEPCLENGIARPQSIAINMLPVDGNPLKDIIKISEIKAHRGFIDARSSTDGQFSESPSAKGLLSAQLRAYYAKHLDPAEMPDPTDIEALEAISNAQKSYDEKLKDGFSSALLELSSLGYPGVTDPVISISTKLKPMDGLNHASAIQYGLNGNQEDLPRLPELYNGLGYQNLISMVFELMRFRDDWMQIGKLGKRIGSPSGGTKSIPTIHLVMIEEPEAHLHVQVQQVFIRKAYGILKNHPDIKDSNDLTVQLLVSTHSSHIAHEVDFGQLRYFRRLPAHLNEMVPISVIISLEGLFGTKKETNAFVTRYLRSVHCELFFADAVIMVEGSAEKILLPHFLETLPWDDNKDTQSEFRLSQSYLSILEIGGSHAHRLRELIECIGVCTLIITDIDPETSEGKQELPIKGKGLKSKNSTVKSWIPEEDDYDTLVQLSEDDLLKDYGAKHFSIRVAYQQPIDVKIKDDSPPQEALPSSFEDALILENLAAFQRPSLEVGTSIGEDSDFQESVESHETQSSRKLTGPIGAVCKIVSNADNVETLSRELYKRINMKNFKAQFALDVLFEIEPNELRMPKYIEDGLLWLQSELNKRRHEFNFDDSEHTSK